MKSAIRHMVRRFGLDAARHQPSAAPRLPVDLSDREKRIVTAIAPYTMTSVDRQVALIHAVEWIARRPVAGSIVECGVWRGGSSMAAALTLLDTGSADRDLYLFDTFEGMPPPTDVDRSSDGVAAQAQLDKDPGRTGHVWAVAGIDDVRQNLESTGYPMERVHLVKGMVEQTIPAQAPRGPIALLRLDTDWYESTKHELEHLFPLLAEGGVLIIDDYGHWQGARKAVDEYLATLERRFYLHRIDYTGRLLTKL